MFRLISGDLLPGSKFIFFLLPAALFLGIYRFLRHYGVPAWFAIPGVLGLLSCPIIYQHLTLRLCKFALYRLPGLGSFI